MLIQVFDDVWVDPALVRGVRVHRNDSNNSRFTVMVTVGEIHYADSFESREAALVFARGMIVEINKALGYPDQPGVDLQQLWENLQAAVEFYVEGEKLSRLLGRMRTHYEQAINGV